VTIVAERLVENMGVALNLRRQRGGRVVGLTGRPVMHSWAGQQVLDTCLYLRPVSSHSPR
jgi:hypothetical protein